MQGRFAAIGSGSVRRVLRILPLAALVWAALMAGPATAADERAAPAAGASGSAMGDSMNAAGWLEHVAMRLEAEAMSDAGMLPETPAALDREWRSFARDGSALGALVAVLWVTLAAALALVVETAVARRLGRPLRQRMRQRPEAPGLQRLLLLLVCDTVGLAAFAAVFVYSRHRLMAAGASSMLVVFGAEVLIRWRIAALVVRAVLRPGESAARLVEIPDREAYRLSWFLDGTILAIVVLVGFGRYGLADEDSGAAHVVGLFVAAIVSGLVATIVLRARGAAEALIRGRPRADVLGAVRAALARAWVPTGLIAAAALMVFFVFGLSLGLLSYYHATTSTLGVLFLLLVLERLTERGLPRTEIGSESPAAVDRLVARSFRRIVQALVLAAAAATLAWIWIAALEISNEAALRGMHAAAAATATLFLAYLAWELSRLAIDRHLQTVPGGPKLPGAEEGTEPSPGSRLQTVLPMLRAAFGVLIAVVATLIVLSRLGVDTAPLLAGAGVFGLAISFGSQSLVRDVISGLFYMWDDAFRVGEYIDTGRLRGTVEALGVRSLKLRHHNGPLHTIPYGQLGAVTNLSRDFATIKFNLRFEPGTDVELVRKTAKQIGIAMQEDPEIAAEVILPLKLQGIAEIADGAVVLRFKFTARPVKPSWVQREYLKRIYRDFAAKGIVLASGTLYVQTAPSPPGPVPLAAPAAALPDRAIAPAPSRVA